MNDELSFVDRLILSDELYEALRLIKQAIAEGSEKGLEARVIADALASEAIVHLSDVYGAAKASAMLRGMAGLLI